MSKLMQAMRRRLEEEANSSNAELQQSRPYGSGSGSVRTALPGTMSQLPDSVLKPYFMTSNPAPTPAPTPAKPATATNFARPIEQTKKTTAKPQATIPTKEREVPNKQEPSKDFMPPHIRSQSSWDPKPRSSAVEQLEDLIQMDPTPASEPEGYEGGGSDSETTDHDRSITPRVELLDRNMKDMKLINTPGEQVGTTEPSSPAASIASMDGYVGSQFAKDRFGGRRNIGAKGCIVSGSSKQTQMGKATATKEYPKGEETVLVRGSSVARPSKAGSSSTQAASKTGSAPTHKAVPKQLTGSIISIDDDALEKSRNSDVISIGSSASTTSANNKEPHDLEFSVPVPRVTVPKVKATFNVDGVRFSELVFDDASESEYVPSDSDASSSSSSTDITEDGMKEQLLEIIAVMRHMHGCTIDIIDEMKKNMRKAEQNSNKAAAAIQEASKNNVIIANTLLEISIGSNQIPSELMEITKALKEVAECLKHVEVGVGKGGAGRAAGGSSGGGVEVGKGVTCKDLDQIRNELKSQLEQFNNKADTKQADVNSHLALLSKRVKNLQTISGIVDDNPRNTLYQDSLDMLTQSVTMLSDRISRIESALEINARETSLRNAMYGSR